MSDRIRAYIFYLLCLLLTWVLGCFGITLKWLYDRRQREWTHQKQARKDFMAEIDKKESWVFPQSEHDRRVKDAIAETKTTHQYGLNVLDVGYPEKRKAIITDHSAGIGFDIAYVSDERTKHTVNFLAELERARRDRIQKNKG